MEIEDVLSERLETIDKIREAFSRSGFEQYDRIRRGPTQDALIIATGLMDSGHNRKLINEVLATYYGYNRVKIAGNHYFRRVV